MRFQKNLKKTSFFFAFKQKYLDGLMSSRFSILEEIRNINLGNDQSATISIGIGVGKGTYMERYEWARGAMDLALGRGGDQAVVKNGEKEQFFGGKRVQIERNTRVKARVKAQCIKGTDRRQRTCCCHGSFDRRCGFFWCVCRYLPYCKDVEP